MTTRAFTEQVKVGLAAGAMLAVVIGFVLARLKARARQDEAAREYMTRTPIIKIGRLSLNASQTLWVALLLFALFGTINYNRYNTNLIVDGYDEYDLLHYYVNAKYYDELGSFNLLPALIIADHEVGEYCPGKAPIYLFQDENDYQRRPIRHALAREKEVKSRFSEKRWKEFVADAIYIQRVSKRLICPLYRQLLQDHGFNGTPVWVLIARPIASVVPVEWIKACTLIDLVWILVMLGAVAWAFGAETFLFAWIFIVVSYSFRWPTITWAFLRYDWFATMVLGICMVKKEKHIAGGAFFAYATLMRYFPGLWLFGIVAKGVHAVFTRRDIPLKRIWQRVPTKYYKMALGFLVTVVILVGASIARDGLAAHERSLKNMIAHVEPHNLSSMRQGLVIALSYRGETDQKLISDEKRLFVEKAESTVRVIGLVAMLVLGLFMSRLKDWEVLGLGVIPYFWLTTSSYYYYSMRMTAIVIHAADLSKTRNVVALLILFGIELFCHASQYLNAGNRYFLISVMGILLTLYTITMMVFLGVKWFNERRGDPINAGDGTDKEQS